MSSAFVKEAESEQLKDITPNMASLLIFLKLEYGSNIHVLKTAIHPKHQKEVHEMSDGLGYMINDQNQWQIILD